MHSIYTRRDQQWGVNETNLGLSDLSIFQKLLLGLGLERLNIPSYGIGHDDYRAVLRDFQKHQSNNIQALVGIERYEEIPGNIRGFLNEAIFARCNQRYGNIRVNLSPVWDDYVEGIDFYAETPHGDLPIDTCFGSNGAKMKKMLSAAFSSRDRNALQLFWPPNEWVEFCSNYTSDCMEYPTQGLSIDAFFDPAWLNERVWREQLRNIGNFNDNYLNSKRESVRHFIGSLISQ